MVGVVVVDAVFESVVVGGGGVNSPDALALLALLLLLNVLAGVLEGDSGGF